MIPRLPFILSLVSVRKFKYFSSSAVLTMLLSSLLHAMCQSVVAHSILDGTNKHNFDVVSKTCITVYFPLSSMLMLQYGS